MYITYIDIDVIYINKLFNYLTIVHLIFPLILSDKSVARPNGSLVIHRNFAY